MGAAGGRRGRPSRGVSPGVPVAARHPKGAAPVRGWAWTTDLHACPRPLARRGAGSRGRTTASPAKPRGQADRRHAGQDRAADVGASTGRSIAARPPASLKRGTVSPPRRPRYCWSAARSWKSRRTDYDEGDVLGQISDGIVAAIKEQGADLRWPASAT